MRWRAWRLLEVSSNRISERVERERTERCLPWPRSRQRRAPLFLPSPQAAPCPSGASSLARDAPPIPASLGRNARGPTTGEFVWSYLALYWLPEVAFLRCHQLFPCPFPSIASQAV